MRSINESEHNERNHSSSTCFLELLMLGRGGRGNNVTEWQPVVKVVTLRFTDVCEGYAVLVYTSLRPTAQTYISVRGEGGRTGGRQVAKFLLPQIAYHFSPPQKSPECETAASATAVQTKNTNSLWTSKMPADMFRWASLHNECWFSANCLDNELTGFIAMVHSDPGFLLLETKH